MSTQSAQTGPKRIDFHRLLTQVGIPAIDPDVEQGTKRKFVKFCDFHGHARNSPDTDSHKGPQSRMMTAICTTLPFFQTQIWMPNLNPDPIETAVQLGTYFGTLRGIEAFFFDQAEDHENYGKFKHHIALKLTAKTTKEDLVKVASMMQSYGIIKVVKIYPDGVTTNSSGGWQSLEDLYPAIEAAINLGFIICLHGEQPDGKQPGETVDTLQRERIFVERNAANLVEKFPQGKFHLEHITTKEAVDFVLSQGENVGAGITPQHLVWSLNDLLEWQQDGRTGINPHHYCRPPVQQFADLKALLKVALHASNPAYQSFCFSSDSAPHAVGEKLCVCGCAGVFSAPVSPFVIVSLFEAAGKLDTPHFEAFMYSNGAKFFGVEIDETQTFEMERKPWVVPATYGGIAPMYAGCELPWKPMAPAILYPYP